MSTKSVEFIDNPMDDLTRKKVDALATDLIYNTDVMNIEASGGHLQQDHKHTIEDSEKVTRTGVDILLACLRKYLDASSETAKKLKTYSIQVLELFFVVCFFFNIRSLLIGIVLFFFNVRSLLTLQITTKAVFRQLLHE